MTNNLAPLHNSRLCVKHWMKPVVVHTARFHRCNWHFPILRNKPTTRMRRHFEVSEKNFPTCKELSLSHGRIISSEICGPL
ncbi:unnamed protein product [Lasius platythorax]|uniref:Uncharacterized protein n=1 Tax=Lasius platythorax TaxID=488582 RepID=A0AAV2P360_9HYME